MRNKRVLAIMHKDLVPPDSIEGLTEAEVAPFKTEYDVITACRTLGHEVRSLGIQSDLSVLGKTIEEWKPHIVFNLLEEFDGEAVMDHNVVSYLELLKLPYTGCSPRGLILARDKGLSKKILSYHRVRVPAFAVFPRRKAVKRPSRLKFPLFVKSLIEEASLGIAQASIVDDDEKLKERVAFIHERIGTDAIAEQYIEGREFYVSVLGNRRLEVFPIWELKFTKAGNGVPLIATAKVKFDLEYQKKLGVETSEAKDLAPEVVNGILRLCKRIYRNLGLKGYARIDMRMTADGQVYVLEANPNPQLARGEDFAESARAVGIAYERLIQRIMSLGFSRAR